MTRRRVVLGAAAGAVGAAGGAALIAGLDPMRRERVRRASRVWRLTARNGARYAVVKVRGVRADEARRAELGQDFAIRTAEDVARELGQMKGALMKAGQMIGFIAEALPEEAQRALATLQADAPPMAPELAEKVVTEELGPPRHVFLDWSPIPVAAASVGQVHRAVTRDGRVVAVKVQYPGVREAIGADLDNAELLYSMLSSFTWKGIDTKALVDELRSRMLEELDYHLEAANQTEFARGYEGHPFVKIPAVVPELSTARVITTEWVDGMGFAEFLEHSSPPAKQRAGEAIWRFAQHSVIRLGAFNGDPHPGNYRFSADGAVTFLDFGLVKRWTSGEWERLAPTLTGILARDPARLVAAMEEVRFLQPGHGLDVDDVFGYVSAPYRPYLSEEFTFTRDYLRETLEKIFDLRGPYAPVVEKLNMPVSFVILDRVVWGVSAILGKLGATGPWRAMIHEYIAGGPPSTELGHAEAQWRAARGQRAARRQHRPMDLHTAARHFERFRRIEDELAALLGSWIPAPEPGVSEHLAARCREHTWHEQLWAQRVPAPALVDVDIDVSAGDDDDILGPLRNATTMQARLGGFYRDVLPRLTAEYRDLLAATDPRLDAPTVRVLQLVLRDEQDAQREGDVLLARLASST